MKNNVTVIIRDDYIIHDNEEIQKILDRVSKIISGSYVRRSGDGK